MAMSTKLGAIPTRKGGRLGLMLVKGGTMVAANAHDRAWKSIAYFCITHTHTQASPEHDCRFAANIDLTAAGSNAVIAW